MCHCFRCGRSEKVTTEQKQDRFDYGPPDHEWHAMLTCVVPVRTCGYCNVSWTDEEAADIRDKAASEHTSRCLAGELAMQRHEENEAARAADRGEWYSDDMGI